MLIRIREKLKEKGVKVKDISESLGVTSATFHNWCNGVILVRQLKDVADYLGCHVFELMDPGDEFQHLRIEGKYRGVINK